MKKISLIFLTIIIALLPCNNYQTNRSNNYDKIVEEEIINENDLKQNEINNTNKISEKEKKSENSEEESFEKKEVEENYKNQVIETTKSIQPTNIDLLTVIKNKNDSLGTAGRLYIPEVNINVGINHANYYDDGSYNAQEIVDKEDSAAYFTFYNKTTIADHQHQGFYKIADLKSESKAYIKKADGTIEVYQLVNKLTGKNTSYDLVDSSGNSIQNMNGSLLIYTCYGLNNGVLITLWNRLA